MANPTVPARSEHNHSPTYHLAARAARKAVRQWFAGIPTQSLAVWRDMARNRHCEGLPDPEHRGQAFDDAYAREIGLMMIAGGKNND